MYLLFKMVVFHCYVSLPKGKLFKLLPIARPDSQRSGFTDTEPETWKINCSRPGSPAKIWLHKAAEENNSPWVNYKPHFHDMNGPTKQPKHNKCCTQLGLCQQTQLQRLNRMIHGTKNCITKHHHAQLKLERLCVNRSHDQSPTYINSRNVAIYAQQPQAMQPEEIGSIPTLKFSAATSEVHVSTFLIAFLQCVRR